jgi:hypothetical protein
MFVRTLYFLLLSEPRGIHLNESIKNAIERVVLLPVRVRRRKKAAANQTARIAAIDSTISTLRKAQGLKANGTSALYNVALYLLLLDQDLAYFTDDLVCAIGDRRRRFVAKNEAILLYEAAKDLPQLLGKRFRDPLGNLNVPPQLRSAMDSVSSDLSAFWQQHRVFLGAIRNAVAAHREQDALRYQNLLDGIEPLEVMHRAADLSTLLQRLIGAIIDVALLNTDPSALIQDMLGSASQKKAVRGAVGPDNNALKLTAYGCGESHEAPQLSAVASPK